MRLVDDSRPKRRHDWPLYVVASVCFGPLVLILFFGFVFVPLWIGMIVEQLAHPELFRQEDGGGIAAIVWPIAIVACGYVGLAGLFWLLALRPGSSRASRRAILAMVSVGMAGLLYFDWRIFVPGIFESADELPIAALAIYLVLPLMGAVWILRAKWTELFPRC